MGTPTKAVIAAAGLGTRFLPQTKAMPKEMLPIIDKPVIQLIVEEAIAAGVTDIIIVTGAQKRALEDHFDRAIELEEALRANGKAEAAEEIKHIAEMANFVYIRQKGEPKGNARPVLNAAHLLDDEPFFVFFADDFFRAAKPRAVQLKEAFEETGKSIISLIEVGPAEADKYGIIEPGKQIKERLVEVKRLIEKPGEKSMPSKFASIGGYLLTPDILPLLERLTPTRRGEIELPSAINELAKRGAVYGCFIEGTFHDAGDKANYLRAIVDTALEDERLGDEFRAFLKERLKKEL